MFESRFPHRDYLECFGHPDLLSPVMSCHSSWRITLIQSSPKTCYNFRRISLISLEASALFFYSNNLSPVLVTNCGSLPWNSPTCCQPIRNSTNLQVFVAIQQHTHSNAYTQQYRSVVAMIRLSNSAQQRTAFSNYPTGVLYWVRLKTSTELYVFFNHPSLFTICTSTFSKLVEGCRRMAWRRALIGTLL
jgi:hypothetical protein